MRRLLIMGFAVIAGFAGWASAAGAEPLDASQPLAAAFRVAGPIAPAPETAPDALLSAATFTVTASLRQDKSLQANSQGKIAELVEATILPLFNFRHMTQRAVAPHWRLASAEQQRTLIAEFKTLLVHTYSTALANYRDQAIEYKPLQLASGETEITVKSIVKQPGAERMTIDYDMEKTAAGWKVYDIKIAGISLITTYRSTFTQLIRDGGVDGLIKSLSAKNRQAESGSRPQESGALHFIIMYAVIPSILRGGP